MYNIYSYSNYYRSPCLSYGKPDKKTHNEKELHFLVSLLKRYRTSVTKVIEEYIIDKANSCYINIQNSKKQTVLIRLCKQLKHENNKNNKHLIKLLLNTENIDLAVIDKNKCTALNYCCQHSSDVAEEFIKLDNPYIKACVPNTLWNACENFADNVVKLLIEKFKDDINSFTKSRLTALHFLCQSNKNLEKHDDCYTKKINIFKLLINEPNTDLNFQNSDGWAPLLIISRYSRVRRLEEALQLLLETDKIHLNLQDRNGWTALHHSSRYSNCDSTESTVKMLIDAGSDVNIKDKTGATPLHYACRFADTDSTVNTVKMLLDAGADPNIKNNDGCTPLIISLKYFNQYSLETVKLLLQCSNIDVNVKNNEGITALMMSVVDGKEQILQELINFPNTDLNLQNDKGFTALMLGCFSANDKSVEIILNSNKDSLKDRLNLEVTNIHGDTALLSARSVNILTMLVAAGASVNVQNSAGLTALMIECQKPKLYANSTVQVLINSKANLNLQSKQGYTALMFCNHSKLVNLMIESGARTDIITFSGLSALALANSAKKVKILLKYHNVFLEFTKEEIKNLEIYKNVYNEYNQQKAVMEYIKLTNKVKIIKFIPLRRLQIQSDPNSYSTKMLGYKFEALSGKSLLQDLFATIDPKIKEHFNVKLPEDILKIDLSLT